jgi:predicted transcriptional regulator
MKKRARDPDFQGVSEAERSVLEALWAAGPSTPQALQEALAAGGMERAYTTVQTLLLRLLRKGFVARRAEGASQL